MRVSLVNDIILEIAELSGHTERVLQLSPSPDTTTLLSTGADETLR